jgi:parallel beta-helix repeat protein
VPELDAGGLIIINSGSNTIGGHFDNSGSFTRFFYNYIADNHGTGLLISGANSSSNVILNCTVSRNSGDGIVLEEGAQNNVIGNGGTYYNSRPNEGVFYMEGNYVDENGGWGLRANGAGHQNTIGGSSFNSNGLGGAVVDGTDFISFYAVYNWSTGGSVPCKFQDNNGPGISILSGKGNYVGDNYFKDNVGLPVDLGGDGVTPNDVGDIDMGPNGCLTLQPSPFQVMGSGKGSSTLVVQTVRHVSVTLITVQ